MQKGTEVDADFNDYTAEDAKKDETLLPALQFDLPRHELLAKTETDASAKHREELALDAKLGLKRQAKATGASQLAADIDELTDAKDYHEISARQLSKLFNIGTLKRLCFRRNVVFHAEAFWERLTHKSNTMSLIFFVPSFITFLATLHCVPSAGPTVGAVAFIFASIFSAISLVCWLVLTFDNFSYSHTQLDAKLDVENLDATDVRLPYGVKLKVAEAMDTKIFEGFSIARPIMTEGHSTVDLSHKFLSFIDPAVLGVTVDKRMFMIAYWDIDKDIDKTKESISKFERFKIK